ncbi:MAG: hypothetical protein H0V31_00940, partial [Acidobacteria bacterium]|nr:hypothetical protein [Acidobacteriota bacterium]
VVMTALSVSRSGNHVFKVPLFDPGRAGTSAGGYPWKASGDYVTKLYIKNETDQPQKYTAALLYEGGGYTLGIKDIKAHQLVAIDFRALRDSQTADANGNTIPLNVERGQIAWSGKSTPNGVLSGRSHQSSLSQGISSTYDCRNFCRDSYYDGYIIYDLPFEYVYDVANFVANQQDMNAYGQPLTPYPVTADWQSANSTVASIYSAGEATALEAGTTSIQGSWLAERFIGEVGNEECNFESFTALAEEFFTIIGGDVNFRTVSTGSTVATFSSSLSQSATLNVGKSTNGAEKCIIGPGGGNTGVPFLVVVDFTLPPGAQSIFGEPRSFVSMNADQQFRVNDYNFSDVNYITGTGKIRITLKRVQNTPNNRIRMRIEGLRSEGPVYSGTASVILVCP